MYGRRREGGREGGRQRPSAGTVLEAADQLAVAGRALSLYTTLIVYLKIAAPCSKLIGKFLRDAQRHSDRAKYRPSATHPGDIRL